jgi:hypothetical protein
MLAKFAQGCPFAGVEVVPLVLGETMNEEGASVGAKQNQCSKPARFAAATARDSLFDDRRRLSRRRSDLFRQPASLGTDLIRSAPLFWQSRRMACA